MTKETGWNLDNSYANLSETFFSKIEPSPVNAPEFVIFNEPLAKSLGLNIEELENDEGLATLAGNSVPEGSDPIAQAYAGHQFGHFTMLGDGRALMLGEQITPEGERVDIQLKGSGRTPYSRGGDGRAVLGPMLREYIMSEAMYALGIPTNRSLSVVTTGEDVIRETNLPGAVLTRTASSHLRVGTFQYAARWGTVDELKELADYTIERHFPDIKKAQHPYLALLQEVIKRQAKMIAKWQHVGFIHGVMNTDNMTISGETIDYGPCAFMDTYDPKTVFSSIDREGRYAYENQPPIAGWNLARFAESLLPLIHEDIDEAVKIAQDEISKFTPLYKEQWFSGMRAKLGLFNEEANDESLIDRLLGMMQKSNADYTNTFRLLTMENPSETDLYGKEGFDEWYDEWQKRLNEQEQSKEDAHELMRNNNPAVIPRNHRVEEALQAAVEEEDYSVMEHLLDVLSNPYAYSPEQEEYCTLPENTGVPYRTYCGT
ncbi:protein adenylyltransferase SelO [Texcoconibacillus texcoconensis]|uniref:Protein nucleotidyltransferase YdiU n=1 Tax=Texcoconibacillus texcoconensis TaxID=1095777 RepID=A0A840QTM0_9BACI|nr:YdiU family protein [Texcoconibacillus texcoconensis]MBB5174648.1 uncharacterized protein YdiU (UPF0061 family) [Texcoconibacillus texcoconensis]